MGDRHPLVSFLVNMSIHTCFCLPPLSLLQQLACVKTVATHIKNLIKGVTYVRSLQDRLAFPLEGP